MGLRTWMVRFYTAYNKWTLTAGKPLYCHDCDIRPYNQKCERCQAWMEYCCVRDGLQLNTSEVTMHRMVPVLPDEVTCEVH